MCVCSAAVDVVYCLLFIKDYKVCVEHSSVCVKHSSVCVVLLLFRSCRSLKGMTLTL